MTRPDALPFESERLAMRAQAITDAEALHAAYRDPDLMRYWSSPPHATVEDTVSYLTPRVNHDEWRGWSMTLKGGDDRAIGTLAAHQRRAGVAEIGYMVVPAMQRRGYAREGVARLIELLFAEGNHRIVADVDPENEASVALLEALGFTREGLLRAEWHTHIGLRDSAIYGLLAGEGVAAG